MAHPTYLDAECANEGCDVEHKLELESNADVARFAFDSILAFKDAIKGIKSVEIYDATEKMEEKISQHHNLNVGSDKRLYCDDHIGENQ